MKKALGIILSIVAVCISVCVVVSVNFLRACADGGNTGIGGSGTLATSSGAAHHIVLLYKVTVYADTTNTVTKYSDISNFNIKKVMYFGNDKNAQILGTSLVGSKTKFEYVKYPNDIAATTLSNFRYEISRNTPQININTTDLSGAKRTVENYFMANEDTCYSYVKKVAPEVKKTDSWVLLVEPTVKVAGGKYSYFYTPTEYAVAMNCTSSYGGFNSFNTGKTSDGKTKSVCSLSIKNPGNLACMVDGSWLGVGNQVVNKNWNEVPFHSGGVNKWFEGDRNENFIKYAGVFMWFSGSFENSDFTLPAASNYEKFENETITLSTNVNRTNPGKEGTVTVTLDYRAQNSQIIGNATQTVSFAKGEKSKSVSWQVQVGTYSNYSDYREMPYTIEIAPSGGTVDLNMDNNEVSGTIKLKRDLQVTSVKLNKNECFENENVAVTFSVKNANPYREYSKIPVTVYFVDALGTKTRIGEVTLETLGKGATKNGSCTINVGCVTENADQRDYVIVTVNAYDTNATRGRVYSEPNMSNNKDSAEIKVKRDINLSVSIVEPKSEGYIGNAPSKVKNANSTQAVTSCVVTNRSRFNLYKGNKMKDTITVTFFVNNQKIGSQTVCVPKNGSNLVWFKWNVPESSSVTLRATVEWNVNQENSPSPYIDNEASMTKAIKPVAGCKTPDTLLQLEQGSNSNYFDANGYSRKKPSIAKWSQWICDEEGTFTRIDYALTGDASLSLIPDKKAEYSSGSTVLSGSGFSAVFSYTVRTECSENGYAVSGDDYTYAQNVIATFPEFQYIQTSKSSCRTMYLVKEDGNLGNSRFQFEKNLDRKEYEGKRIHFIPSNMPDGEYKVGVLASELWTPAGPIYVNATSSFVINGSVSNDWYVQ